MKRKVRDLGVREWADIKCRSIEEKLAQIASMSPPLDEGIAGAVITLVKAGIETCQSCEGGPEHAYPEPTVEFWGDYSEGFRALAAIMQSEHSRALQSLCRCWDIQNGEPTGPIWKMVFWRKVPEADVTITKRGKL